MSDTTKSRNTVPNAVFPCLSANTTVLEVLEYCAKVYRRKNAEYQHTSDRFENFTRGAELNQTDRYQTLWGYATKQIVSLASLLHQPIYDVILIQEKAVDILVYMAILISMFLDEGENNDNIKDSTY